MTQLATNPTPTVQYQALAPIGTAQTLRGLISAQMESLKATLPKHVTPERLLKTMLVAVNRNPDLLGCTQASVMETISRAAELGLDLSGTLGEAYPVPFNNKVGDEWRKTCQLIIGYRGLAKLARQSGEIATISSDIVCEHDRFVFRKGSGACCEFEPNLKGERGEPYGAFAHVQFRDGTQQFDFMTVSEIDAVRRRSKSGNDREGNAIGAWRSDWGEMAKKTVFRRLAKWLPLSAEKFQQALEHDDSEYDVQGLVDQAPAPKAKGDAALLAKLVAEPEAATLPQDAPVDVPAKAPTEPQKPAQADPGEAARLEAVKLLKERYLKPTLYPKKKGEKDESVEARFVAWVATTSQQPILGAGPTMEQVSLCNQALSDMEENAP